MIERLTSKASSMSELAEPIEMALPSFLQHLQVLEESGLISSEKSGRVRTYHLNPPPILVAENWLDVQRRRWNTRLDQLEDFLLQLDGDQ